MDASQLSVRVHESADPTRATAEVVATAVRVPPDRVLDVDSALVRDLAAAVFAADACGTAAWALETAASYAKVREQFGRPIGQFQGVKHLCADMLVRVERAGALAWDAARAVQEPDGVRELVTALAAGVALDAGTPVPRTASRCSAASASPGSTTRISISDGPWWHGSCSVAGTSCGR